jgi:hypothetical protein
MSFTIDFIGIGAARCGTTWLYECLKEHPEIFLPEKKELHFFDDDANYNKGITFYESYFNGNTSSLIQGEITPRYLLYKDSISRIKSHYPDVKLIISLRDPVERAFSQYKYFRFNKKKEDNKDFHEALNGDFREDYIEKSLYYENLQHVYDNFDKDNVLVIFTSDIGQRPDSLVKQVYGFLGVNTDYSPIYIHEKINSSQNGFYDPPVFWARFNKMIYLKTREVSGRVRSESPVKNKILNKFISSRLVIFTADKINKLLDRYLNSRHKIHLDKSVKKAIFEKHFKKDTQKLENLLDISLEHWYT